MQTPHMGHWITVKGTRLFRNFINWQRISLSYQVGNNDESIHLIQQQHPPYFEPAQPQYQFRNEIGAHSNYATN
jgi:hypothetical protein